MWKFLTPDGCTYFGRKPFVYNLPRRSEKWARTDHPAPDEPDGWPCGAGRLHLMKSLDASYAPNSWWPWWARGIGLVGEDGEKSAYQSVELRRISRRLFWRCLRPPFNWGCRADLRGADLRGADLRGADLSGANLRRANLHGADLSEADLRWAISDVHTQWLKGYEK